MKERHEQIKLHIDSILRTVNEEKKLNIIRFDVEWQCQRIIEILNELRHSPND